MSKRTLILASASPRRKQLLKEWGFVIKVRVPHPGVERPCSMTATIRPHSYVQQQARRKAADVALGLSQGTVIAADTVVYHKGRIFGKPRNKQNATGMLRDLQGQSHWVYTGVTLRDVDQGIMISSYEKTKVTFKRLGPKDIANYIAKVNVLDKAGGYAIQEYGDDLIQTIQGSRTNVIGLPIELLKSMLRALGKGKILARK